MLLYGLESANQKTIDKLNKGITIAKVKKELKIIQVVNQETGGHLQPHLTCMIGYPWETKKQARKTIEMTRRLFNKGLIDSLQATIVIPYPGTTLFKEAEKNNWLKTKDWNKFDMSQPVMKTPMRDEEILALTRGVYKSFITPRFLLRKTVSIRNIDDLKFFYRVAKAVLGHLADFSFYNSM